MSLWHCRTCSTAYAVGLPACPHCRSTSKEEDGMPKTTVHGGPSYAGHVDTSSPETATPEWTAAAEPAEPQTAVEPVRDEQPDRPAVEPKVQKRSRRS